MEVPFFKKLGRFGVYLWQRGREHGFARLPPFLWRRIADELRERELGINTRGWISSETFTSDPNCLDYDPVDYDAIRHALALVPFTQGQQVLLDYGCGKGRVLAVASRAQFQRVVGIELSTYLADIARDNLGRLAKRFACCPSEVITGDATSYDLPDDVTAIFLFNPFKGEVLKSVVRKIEQSLQRRPRSLLVFHIHFRELTSAFRESEEFRFRKELPLHFREKLSFEVFEARR